VDGCHAYVKAHCCVCCLADAFQTTKGSGLCASKLHCIRQWNLRSQGLLSCHCLVFTALMSVMYCRCYRMTHSVQSSLPLLPLHTGVARIFKHPSLVNHVCEYMQALLYSPLHHLLSCHSMPMIPSPLLMVCLSVCLVQAPLLALHWLSQWCGACTTPCPTSWCCGTCWSARAFPCSTSAASASCSPSSVAALLWASSGDSTLAATVSRYGPAHQGTPLNIVTCCP